MMPFIGRVGGKSKIAEQIVARFPKHEIYVEPFFGGGSVFFRKEKSPIEVINDLDTDIMDIYKDVLKVKTLKNKNFQLSRTKFNKLLKQKTFKSPEERLYRNLYLSLNSFRADRKNYVGAKEERIKSDRGRKYTNEGSFNKYKERLDKVKIFNSDYSAIIKKYDSKDTLFYLDPPYSRAEKNKDYKEVGVKLEDVCQLLKTIKGKFIMSFDTEVNIKNLCPGFKLYKINTRYEPIRGPTKKVTEYLISNFKLS
jgi:DNA adenine methylase